MDIDLDILFNSPANCSAALCAFCSVYSSFSS